ncbi:MAG: DoxX family protein [Cytophagaceae bacterium]|nr:MAG: DoxX family protein [Cytophagaceae bacterium]
MKLAARVLIWLPALALLGSVFAKLSGAKQVVAQLTQVGFLAHFPMVGLALIELVSVVLLLIPATFRLGLLLITAYLGGAIATEISTGSPPAAAILLALIWVGAFLKDRTIFSGSTVA